MATVLVLNGPNLNLLGAREPSVYGSSTLADLERRLTEHAPDSINLEFFQSNHEGEMIDRIHQVMHGGADAIIMNPGAWTHTSVAIRDALSAVALPFVEVHISNVHAREAFRHHSYFSDIALAVIAGCGMEGYAYALNTLNQHLKD